MFLRKRSTPKVVASESKKRPFVFQALLSSGDQSKRTYLRSIKRNQRMPLNEHLSRTALRCTVKWQSYQVSIGSLPRWQRDASLFGLPNPLLDASGFAWFSPTRSSTPRIPSKGKNGTHIIPGLQRSNIHPVYSTIFRARNCLISPLHTRIETWNSLASIDILSFHFHMPHGLRQLAVGEFVDVAILS